MLLLVIALCLAVAGIIFNSYFRKENKSEYKDEDLASFHNVARISSIILASILVIFSIFSQVKTGHIGLVYQFGAIVGEKTEGLQIKAPWQSIQNVNTQTQKKQFQNLSCFSKETQGVVVSGTVNFYIDKQDIQKLYREIGNNYVEKLIDPRVAQACKNQTVLYKTVDIAPNREVIRKAVRDSLMSDPILKGNSIIISDFLLENIDFQEEFKRTIEAKQVSTQEALRAEEIIKIKKAEADQAIEIARGEAQTRLIKEKAEADAILYTAQKQAEANSLISATLTESLLELKRIEKITDKLKIVVIPSGSFNIMDLKGLMGEIIPQ